MVVTRLAVLAPITVVLVLLTVLVGLQLGHFLWLTIHLVDLIENVGSLKIVGIS